MTASCDLLLRCERLVTCAPGNVPRRGSAQGCVEVIESGIIAIADGRVVVAGPASLAAGLVAREERDLGPGCVVPGLVDAHTHPVWAGSRLDEFARRAAGATYQDIMREGGGILSTVDATRRAAEADLVASTLRTFERMLRHGTTTVEAKTGYGLDEATELRDLRILREVAARSAVRVVPTYLGAHALPPEHRETREVFVQGIVERTLPQIAALGLAEFCDVFCEEGAFTVDESRRILEAARACGLGLKAHVEEFAYLGGARMAASLGAVSVDHLLSLPTSDFEVLAASQAVAVLLPGTSFFLGKERFAPARGLVGAGVPVAVATDFNAGSCMTESLPMALSLAVLAMRLTPAEALLAGTVNAAHAVGRGQVVGSLEPGKQADFIVLDVSDYREWLYHFGVNLVREVWIGGRCAASSAASQHVQMGRAPV